jgi:protein SCO1/2
MATPTRWFAALLPAVLVACAGEPLPVGGGVELSPPLPRHDFSLTATDGLPFRFREATEGQLTFLFFGYTNCPDVCPVQMAGLAAAIRELVPEDQQRVKVVFVTTDPRRDSAPAVRSWLDHFSTDFIGLTGSDAAVDSAQRLFGLAPALREPPRADSSYLVGHAAQVIVFGADDSARTAYPFGQRQTDWARELRLLLHVAPPAAAAVPLTPARAAYPDGFAVVAPSGTTGAAYPVLRSTVALVDTLMSVASPEAESVHVHVTARDDGLLVMHRVERFTVPPATVVRMGPAATHMMLEGLVPGILPGDTVVLELRYSLQGSRVLRLPVRAYEDVARP